MKNDLTQIYLKSILKYDPITGLFVWLVNIGKKIKAGDSAGSRKPNGYNFPTFELASSIIQGVMLG